MTTTSSTITTTPYTKSQFIILSSSDEEEDHNNNDNLSNHERDDLNTKQVCRQLLFNNTNNQLIKTNNNNQENNTNNNPQSFFASPTPAKKKIISASSAALSTRRGRPCTRLVIGIGYKLRELATKPTLHDKDGFYTLDWDYDDSMLVKKAMTPTENVTMICNRIRTLYHDLSHTFIHSGVYIGKTSKQRMGERFSLHRNKTRNQENKCVVMICVASFSNEDVIDALIPFEATGEDMALMYERLVMKQINVPLYSDEMDSGGGGKLVVGNRMELCMRWLYCRLLVVLGNNLKI
jgi:hypothetical protein